MSKTQSYLHDLAEIRSLLERPIRFVSLSGLSGVVTGIFALTGAAIAWHLLAQHGLEVGEDLNRGTTGKSLSLQLLMAGLAVLALTLTTGIWLTIRKSRKTGQPFQSLETSGCVSVEKSFSATPASPGAADSAGEVMLNKSSLRARYT